ncbi:MAG: zinc-dependent alcohol dehydrogenase [Gemmatimonadaceae bacterium]
MRAALMTGVGAVEVTDRSEPELDGDSAVAVIQVESCGICGTDARTFFNGDPRAEPPWVLGHEPVGTIEEVAPGVELPDGVASGDRVFLGSILTCGQCRPCLEGRQNLCSHHGLYGYHPYPGAYAERAAVPRIALSNLYPLPSDLPSDLATTADPFACALNGIEMAEVRMGDTVVILGAGPIGCVQAMMARSRGADSVLLGDISEGRRRLADGVVGDVVDELFDPGEDNGASFVEESTHGGGADRVIVAAPAKPAQQAALRMAGPAARVVYFAGLPKHSPTVDFDANEMHYKELAVLGAYGATPRQYRITLAWLERERERAERIVTHSLPLERIAEGFDAIKSGEGLKVVIRP